ncbi:hypothetical protein MO867_12030 [Microbulbifer sp. OS29]|uniref:Uncharacterized protein n=1 Tax=Microbulbifer okhotskensis TaxID=2926617 RepID=A0A9X2ESQ8_9GAMM|nr:hypothetical protein [Microbulbifer okhotskensis]MCO1335063.1 hypothetical protein [Microbulbifer okhotskensis]
MNSKWNWLSMPLLGSLIFVPVHVSAQTETKDNLEGTWCAVEGESFIFYEHRKDAFTLEKGQICRTFKILKQTGVGGGGRYLEVTKKPDVKHQLTAVEEKTNGAILAKDIGIFAYMKSGNKIQLVAVDVSDESVTNLTLDGSGTMRGFIEEVTANDSAKRGYEAHVGVLFFRRTSETIPETFDHEWEVIFGKTHTRQ